MIGDILQPTHLLFILVIALVVLGPKRLPEVGRSLGRGLRDFRAAMSGEDDEPAEVHAAPAESAPLTTSAATSAPSPQTAAEHSTTPPSVEHGAAPHPTDESS